MMWENSSDCLLPCGCNPCRLCGSSDEMYVEQILNDWHGRGRVIRIGCLCKGAMELDKDESRTSGFDPESEAVAEWNEMNPLTEGRVRKFLYLSFIPGCFGMASIFGCRAYHFFFHPEWTEPQMVRELWPLLLAGFILIYLSVARIAFTYEGGGKTSG